MRKGDEWVCGRPEEQGGPCPTGPTGEGICSHPIPKCHPARSLRSWRGLISIICAGVTLGTLLLIFASKRGDGFLSPGELSFAHSSAAARCADCHDAAHGESPVAWVHPAAELGESSRQSMHCLDCHTVGAQPFQAHGLSADRLTMATQRAEQNPGSRAKPAALALSGVIAGSPMQNGEAPGCATCHREHQGRTHDLKRLSNQQCQSCHAAQFTSLANGHPSFESSPTHRRTRIIFDHYTHLNQHFRDEKQNGVLPISCAHCHESDTRGQTMLVKPFEQSCGSCHQHTDQIRGVGRPDAPSVTFIRLPGLDAETLRAKGFDIGAWPEFAEGRTTPFLELLLGTDPQINSVLDRLAKVDLMNLGKADTNTLKAAQQLAWAVKGLFSDLTRAGQPELMRRLQIIFHSNLPPAAAEAMLGEIPPDLIRAATAAWFPNLEAEVRQFRAEGKISEPAKPPAPAAAEKSTAAKPEIWTGAGGWYRSDADYTLNYRVSRHADEFLTAWLNATVAVTSSSNAAAQRIFKELADPKAPGFCAKCHSADTQPAPLVNWIAARPEPFEHRFTRFSHSAHFGMLDDTGCFTCHPLKNKEAAAEYAASFGPGKGNPSIFHSSFAAVEKNLCASCHVEKRAGDSCLVCHNYHVGNFIGTLTPRQAQMQKFRAPAPAATGIGKAPAAASGTP